MGPRAEDSWRVGVQAGGAPGVYVERLTPVAPPGPWRTDIAGFVGLAEKGEVGRAVRVESQEAFRARFGDPVAGSYLAHAVRGFFANGGRTCWIARVARVELGDGEDAAPPHLALGELGFRPGDPVAARVTGEPDRGVELTVRALSPGRWATGLRVALQAAGARLTVVVAWSKGSESYPLDAEALAQLAKGRALRVGDVGLSRSPTLAHVEASRAETGLALFAWGRLAFPAGDPVAVHLTGDAATPLGLWVRASLPEAAGAGLEVALDRRDGGVALDLAGPDGATRHPLDAAAVAHLRAGHPLKLGRVVLERGRIDAGTLAAGRLAATSLELADPPASGLAEGGGVPTAEDFIGDATGPSRRGLALLAEIPEISMVAVPDLFALRLTLDTVRTREAPPVTRASDGDAYRRFCRDGDDGDEDGRRREATSYLLSVDARRRVRGALIGQAAKLRDRVAILDAPPDDAFLERADISGGASPAPTAVDLDVYPRSIHAACYTPWLEIRRLGDRLGRLAVPPSGHVAGRIARHDREVSVASPPANLELNDVADLVATVVAERHASLNERGINVIRPFFGGGIRIMGARTFAPNVPEFRYLHARRLVSMVADAIFTRAHWTVFEPHDPTLWRGVTRVVTSILFDFWRDGRLAGASREEAFFVRCDADTNPPAERAAGRLLCLVGIRPPPPAEFVVLRFGLTRGGIETLPVEAAQMYR